MKKSILLIVGCICWLCACSSNPAELVEVRVVDHVAARTEHAGDFWSEKITYEHWVYENTHTHERKRATAKLGNVGDTFKVNWKHLQNM